MTSPSECTPKIQSDFIYFEYKKIRETLISNKILFKHLEADIEQKIMVPRDISLDPNFTVYCKTNSLFSCKSFSYSNSPLGYGVYVGRYCSIGAYLSILGAHHFPGWISTSPQFYGDGFHSSEENTSPAGREARCVSIGHDVWIGSTVTLKNKIRIGNGSIVAANSVVTKDIDDFMIVGGNPARVIRPRFSEKLIERINATQWWRYSPKDLKFGNANEPDAFLSSLEEKISSGKITAFLPQSITLETFLRLV